MNMCYSCGMPLTGEAADRARGNLCEYCSDDAGNLKPREEVVFGIAQWLKSWSPETQEDEFIKRASSYMDAMPAWQGK